MTPTEARVLRHSGLALAEVARILQAWPGILADSAAMVTYRILHAVTVAAGATLSGTGTVGSTTVFGTLRPGSAANPDGILSVHGDVTFSGLSAIFALELDGTGVGQYSQLSTASTVDLETFTSLDLTIGYAATSGDTFAGIITSANLVGTLGFVPPGFQDSYSFTNLDLSIQ